MVANVHKEPIHLKTDKYESRGLGFESRLESDGVVDVVYDIISGASLLF